MAQPSRAQGLLHSIRSWTEAANRLVGVSHPRNGEGGRLLARPRAAILAARYPMVNSWVCGFRWPSFMAPTTVLSLRSQVVNPRVMSDS